MKITELRSRQESVATFRIPAMQVIYDLRIADQRLMADLYGYAFAVTDSASADKSAKQVSAQVQRVEEDMIKLREIRKGLRLEKNKQRITQIDETFSRLKQTVDLIVRDGHRKKPVRQHAIVESDATTQANSIRDIA